MRYHRSYRLVKAAGLYLLLFSSYSKNSHTHGLFERTEPVFRGVFRRLDFALSMPSKIPVAEPSTYRKMALRALDLKFRWVQHVSQIVPQQMFQSFDLILLLTIKVPTISGSGPIGSSNRDLEVPLSDGSRARRTPRMSFSARLGKLTSILYLYHFLLLLNTDRYMLFPKFSHSLRFFFLLERFRFSFKKQCVYMILAYTHTFVLKWTERINREGLLLFFFFFFHSLPSPLLPKMR